MKTFALPLLAMAAIALARPAAAAADLELWRLDCGSIAVKDLSSFNDTSAYAGEKRELTDSCYLIRHGSDYMLWDTGLPAALVGKPQDTTQAMAPTLAADIPSQLQKIDVKPSDISIVGISHNHFDHLGQAAAFPQATLLIGEGDWKSLQENPLPFAVDPSLVEPWLKGGSKVDPVVGDRDVFGDGSVVMLSMTGHTKGETALLVNLAETGPVILSGDVVHFEEQIANRGVPPFNVDRADSLAAMERLTALAKNLNAKLVIQHDATHIDRLPAFPESAR